MTHVEQYLHIAAAAWRGGKNHNLLIPQIQPNARVWNQRHKRPAARPLSDRCNFGRRHPEIKTAHPPTWKPPGCLTAPQIEYPMCHRNSTPYSTLQTTVRQLFARGALGGPPNRLISAAANPGQCSNCTSPAGDGTKILGRPPSRGLPPRFHTGAPKSWPQVTHLQLVLRFQRGGALGKLFLPGSP
jgi:hypothetical protein